MYERHETTPSAKGSGLGSVDYEVWLAGTGTVPTRCPVVARVLGGLLLARLFTVITLSPEMMMGRS